jgi:hypothetical protein
MAVESEESEEVNSEDSEDSEDSEQKMNVGVRWERPWLVCPRTV